MDLDAESVTDAKNNLNTARWAVYFTNTSCLDLPSEFSFDAKQTRGSSVAVLIRHLPSANCFDTLFQPELTFYAASETHLYLSLSHSQHLFTFASFLCIFTCHMMILHPQLVVNSCNEYTAINVACSVKTDKCCFTPIYLKQAKYWLHKALILVTALWVFFLVELFVQRKDFFVVWLWCDSSSAVIQARFQED